MLEIKNVSVRYGEKEILKDVSLSLRPHRLTVLVGRNGSGKSTLLSCVNQQIPYTGLIMEGEKNLALLQPRERAKMVAILPQTLPAPHITAEEMAAFGRNPYLDFTGRLTQKDKQAVKEALLDTHSQDLAQRYADTLSGGERQRVALAMILAQDTPIALLDEPTAHMDQANEEQFLRLLRNLQIKKKKTFLLILHDLSLAVRYADDMIMLDEGRILFSGTREECLAWEIIEKNFGVERFTFRDQGTEQIFFAPKNESKLL